MSLEDFDLTGFWEESPYATKHFVDEPVTPALLEKVERTLRYKLPAAYVEVMRHQNGGMPQRTRHPMSERTSWSKDHISITAIFAIGEKKPYSLLGEKGSRFWPSEWGYPRIGVYFANCPSGGHDMLCLDYRECGAAGEPRVVHIDQEFDYKVTFVAPNFESFLRGLVIEDAIDLDD